MMFCHFALAVLLCFLSSALGVTITAPANGAVIPANGYHQISWTHTALDAAQMDIYFVSTVTGQATLIASGVNVSANLYASISINLPVGSGFIIQCTAVSNPSDVLAQSGPYTVNSGSNPLSLQTVSGSTAAPSGESISVFSGPAGTGSIAISTITNALETTSVPTTALVVSSAVVSTTSAIVLTATTTLYTDLANVTSVGSVEVPGTVLFSPPPPEIPLVIHTVTIGPPIASFRKWKRVADESSVSLAAVTISGTRGQTTSTPTSATSPATTISNTPTPTTITSTPPPVTVTASASTSIVTLSPTLITITPAVNVTTPHATPQPPPPPPPPNTITVAAPAPATTFTAVGVNSSGTLQTVVETEPCAICTAGLINSGTSLGVGFVFFWSWIGVVVLVVVTYL